MRLKTVMFTVKQMIQNVTAFCHWNTNFVNNAF